MTGEDEPGEPRNVVSVAAQALVTRTCHIRRMPGVSLVRHGIEGM